jgi:HK97 family phage major capsid protein
MAEFNALINDALDARIKALGLDKVDLKHGVVPSNDEVAKMDPRNRAFGLIRSLFDRDYVRAAAMSGGVGPEGGYLLPEEFRAEVIREIITIPVIRARATVFPVAAAAGSMPRLAGAVKMYWEGENQTLTETTVGAGSDLELGQVLWRVWRLDGMLRSSRELFDDAGVNVAQLVVTLFAEGFRAAEDKAFMTGSGVGQPLGLRNTAGVASQAQAGANLVIDDIIKLIYKLGRQYRPGAVFLLHNDIVKLVRLLKDSQLRPIWVDAVEAGGIANQAQPARLYGYPAIEQDDIPMNLGAGTESEIWFGNLRWYYIFDRQQMAVETTTEGAGAFEKHQQVIKVYERLDGELSLTQSFAKLTAVK